MFESIEEQFDFIDECLRAYGRICPDSPATRVMGLDPQLRRNISDLSMLLKIFKDLTIDSQSRDSSISFIPFYCSVVLRTYEEARKPASRNFIKSFAETLESQFLERITTHYGASTVYDPSGGESDDEQSISAIDSIDRWMLESHQSDGFIRFEDSSETEDSNPDSSQTESEENETSQNSFEAFYNGRNLSFSSPD